MCVYIYIYIYIYAHTYTHIHTCIRRAPDYGMVKNSKSISLFASSDDRKVGIERKILTICETPEVEIPPPIEFSV